jgi:multidrug efflux system membrane fusion protein
MGQAKPKWRNVPGSGILLGVAEEIIVNRNAIAFLFLGVLSFGCAKQEPPAEGVRPARVVKVALGVQSHQANYSGEVRARFETALAFRVGGKIAKRHVEVGSIVKAGQVLAELDPQDLRLVEAANRAQLAAAQADFELAERDLKRYTDLLEKKFISLADYERRKNLFDTAKARFAQVKAQHEVSANQAAYGQLLADHDGVIVSIEAEAGQVVATGQPVMRLARPQEKEVVVSVPENRLAELSAAQDIRIGLWAEPGKLYRGRVREISPAADPVTRTYTAKVTVLDAVPAMQLGMTANVLLGGGTPAPAAELPLTALYQQGGESAVWLVEPASSKVLLMPVKVGEYREKTFTVLSGLKDGDSVVSAGVHKLVPGQQVRVIQQ